MVDFPEPFSPTRTVRPGEKSRPLRRTGPTAGTHAGHRSYCGRNARSRRTRRTAGSNPGAAPRIQTSFRSTAMSALERHLFDAKPGARRGRDSLTDAHSARRLMRINGPYAGRVVLRV